MTRTSKEETHKSKLEHFLLETAPFKNSPHSWLCNVIIKVMINIHYSNIMVSLEMLHRV